MGGPYFIGCLHLGAEGMARHRGFYDSWEHDEHLIRCWNSVVPKRAKVFILGDITMENSKHYHKLDELNGEVKCVVLGNHDRVQDVPKLLEHVQQVAGMIDYNGYALTHCPIHPNEVHFYKGNIHAHIHHINVLQEMEIADRYQDNESIPVSTRGMYINVDAHLLDYKPINFEQIKERYEQGNSNSSK